MKNERKIVYVPILHTSADMGSLAESMQKTYTKKFGKQKWSEHVRAIDKMWEGIEKRIRALKLPFKRTKIYQDGLPVCGKEKEIIRELAQKGSRNHKLVLWLMSQGAMMMGTEDPELLIREYNHHKRIMEAKTNDERERFVHKFAEEAGELLKKRDQKIRDRIVETLQQGETGILFLGLLHHVDELLPPDMKVSYLIHRLPFRRSFEMQTTL